MQAYSYESYQIEMSPLIKFNTRNIIVLMIVKKIADGYEKNVYFSLHQESFVKSSP